VAVRYHEYDAITNMYIAYSHPSSILLYPLLLASLLIIVASLRLCFVCCFLSAPLLFFLLPCWSCALVWFGWFSLLLG